MASAGLRRFLQHVPPISSCFIGLHKASSCENNNSQSQQSNSNHDQHVHHHNNTNTDYDYYIHHPTVDDLPILLHKFQYENLNVWPWIWTQSNENGPHHVYIGIDAASVLQIQHLRKSSAQNNILIVADETTLQRAAKEAGLEDTVYEDCHCGIVCDAKLQLLNVNSKILMLDDERVVSFDRLTIC